MKQLLKKIVVGSFIFILTYPSYSSIQQSKEIDLEGSIMQTEIDFPKIPYIDNEIYLRDLKFQNTFNNIYRTTSSISGLFQGKPFESITNGTSYNFKDVGTRSYYLETSHTIKPLHRDFKNVKINKINIYDIDGNVLKARLEFIDPKFDVSILSTIKDKHKPQNIKPIKYSNLVSGELCYLGGYPEGVFRAVKMTNIASVIQNQRTNQVVITLDEVVAMGFSGGPGFVIRNGKLRFIGYITSTSPSLKVSYATPYDTIEKLLKKYKYK